ncbi:unnamed protein product [Knipowitschia caucasica]
MSPVLGQNLVTMEKQKVVGGSCTFICTVCGDGFNQYQNVLTHMSIHGPLESFTFDGSSNGFEVPREYVLQENGTLTVLTGLPNTPHTTMRSASPGILPSHFSCPANVVTPLPGSFPRDVFPPKTPDSNLDNFGKNYPCEVCSRTFDGLQFLLNHQLYRNLEGGYRCTLCCRYFNNRLELKRHVHNHTYEKFHSCTFCGKRFVKLEALTVHMNQDHSARKQSDNLENGQDDSLQKIYTCKKCKLTFFWLTDFQIHSFFLCKGREVLAASEIVETSQKQCNGTSNHAKKKCDDNKETDSTYRCGLCGERFSELTALKEHHTTHESQQNMKNLQNPKSVNRVMTKRRIRSKHFIVNSCRLCSCVFYHSNSLTQHMKYHKGHIAKQVSKHLFGIDHQTDSAGKQKKAPGNYKCRKCGKIFGLLCIFKTHLHYHKKEKKAAADSAHGLDKDEKPPQEVVEESLAREATQREECVFEGENIEENKTPINQNMEILPLCSSTEPAQTNASVETSAQHQEYHDTKKNE